MLVQDQLVGTTIAGMKNFRMRERSISQQYDSSSGWPVLDLLERLSQADLIGVVRDLIGEVGRLRAQNEKLS